MAGLTIVARGKSNLPCHKKRMECTPDLLRLDLTCLLVKLSGRRVEIKLVSLKELAL